jgi:hypothetical protein
MVVLISVVLARDSGGSIGGAVAEALAVYGTIVVCVVVLLTAVAYLLRPSSGLAAIHSWLALAVLLANLSLAIAGYWARAPSLHHVPPYDLAPLLPVVSAVALLPAVIGHIAWALRARGRSS